MGGHQKKQQTISNHCGATNIAHRMQSEKGERKNT